MTQVFCLDIQWNILRHRESGVVKATYFYSHSCMLPVICATAQTLIGILWQQKRKEKEHEVPSSNKASS